MSTPPLLDLLKVFATTLLGVAGLTFTMITWFVAHRGEREKRDDQLLAWGTRGLDVMAKIETLCLHGEDWSREDFNRRRAELAAEASALLDQGRIYFPNVGGEGRTDPSGAGLRPKILDELRLAYLVAGDIAHGATDRNRQRRDELWNGRGRFVAYLRVAVGDKRKREGEAGKPGRSVELAPLEADAPAAGKGARRIHRR